MFDFARLCADYRIDSADEGNKHTRPGWIQVHCPFCTGSRNYHLGFSLAANIFTCYRCGREGKGKHRVISALLSVDVSAAARLVKQYDDQAPIVKKKRKSDRVIPETIELPPHTCDMSKAHHRYLHSRGYYSRQLADTFGLKGTSALGPYKNRIIAPVNLNGNLVSYQGRDITDRSPLKYKACSMAKEIVHHKDIVYAADLVKGRSAVIVEGIADVWRLGPGAVCTFGTGFSSAQVRFICEQYDEAFIVFDAEEEAQRQADRLAHLMSSLRHDMAIECIELIKGDPGELRQGDADALMSDLVNGGWS